MTFKIRRILFFVCLCVVMCACSQDTAPPRNGGIEQDIVWKSGTDGYDTYRIPAIVVTPKGTVLAFCLYERGDEHPYESIVLARFMLSDLHKDEVTEKSFPGEGQ